jgi:hypothetical protein
MQIGSPASDQRFQQLDRACSTVLGTSARAGGEAGRRWQRACHVFHVIARQSRSISTL